jgi:hypothetical protein
MVADVNIQYKKYLSVKRYFLLTILVKCRYIIVLLFSDNKTVQQILRKRRS